MPETETEMRDLHSIKLHDSQEPLHQYWHSHKIQNPGKLAKITCNINNNNIYLYNIYLFRFGNI